MTLSAAGSQSTIYLERAFPLDVPLANNEFLLQLAL